MEIDAFLFHMNKITLQKTKETVCTVSLIPLCGRSKLSYDFLAVEEENTEAVSMCLAIHAELFEKSLL